jgi:hypothetical protein
MSETLDTLNRILVNIQTNKDNVAKQIVASTKAMGDPTPEVLAAIELMITTYGPNVQVIGQTIGARLQIDEMKRAAVEIDAMIAGLQVLLADETNLEAVQTLIANGAAAAPGPLPVATGTVESPVADAAPVETPAAATTEAADSGIEDITSALLDGAVTS